MRDGGRRDEPGAPMRKSSKLNAAAFPRSVALAFAASLALGACAEPRYAVHGYAPRSDELQRLTAGEDTTSTVRRKLGEPTIVGTFESGTWYYVSTVTEQKMYHHPVPIDRTVVQLSFNDAGVLEGVNRYGLEDGRVVNLENRTTPTFGRELTIVQQLFGNIGRFSDEGGAAIGSKTGL